MDEDLTAKLNQLTEQIADTSILVANLIEAEAPLPHEVDNANAAVAAVATVYTEIQDLVPGEERETLERTMGRRVTDLRRLASRLPQRSHGRTAKPAELATPGWPDFYRRAEAATNPADRSAYKTAEGYRASGDVEAWCSKCGGLREHTIVAVVDGTPKQVMCPSCGGKHAYRTTPPRSRSEAAETTTPRHRLTAASDNDPREVARRALQKELAEASNVRTIARRERYKVGEIIEHPSYGRGKIENVLKGSLLVRFGDGLKSVSTL